MNDPRAEGGPAIAGDVSSFPRDAEMIRIHLDDDHADVLLDYAEAYAGLTDATSARTSGVDRYGCARPGDLPTSTLDVQVRS